MSDPDAVAEFDGKTISYTYDNGWSFTNRFEGHIRHSSVPRGELAEHCQIVKLREELYLISWIDDEMGLLTQTIDFKAKVVLAAIPVEGKLETEILTGTLTDLGAG